MDWICVPGCSNSEKYSRQAALNLFMPDWACTASSAALFFLISAAERAMKSSEPSNSSSPGAMADTASRVSLFTP